MNKKIIAVFGVLAVLGGGAIGANVYAGKEAEKAISDALYNAKFDRNIRYENVSHNVFSGVTSIENLTVTHDAFGNEPIKISEVNISDIEKDGRDITAISIQIDDAVFPVLKIAQSCYSKRCAGGDWAKDMVVAGYQNIPIDLKLSFDGDVEARSLDLDVVSESDVIGQIKLSAAFKAVEVRRLGDAVKAMSQVAEAGTKSGLGALQSGLSAMSDIGRAFERAELAKIHFDIKDKGGRANTFELDRLKSYRPESSDDIAKSKAQLVRLNLERDLENKGVQRSVARSFADAAGAFVEEGGRLSFKTNIERPLIMFKPGGLFGIMPARDFESIADFLSASGAELQQS